MTVATAIFFGVAWAVVIGSCLFAILKGGPPERLAGAACLVTMAGAWMTCPHDSSAYQQFEAGVAVFDVCQLLMFILLSHWAKRQWLFAAAGAQVIACLAHFAKAIDRTMSVGAYSQMEGFAIWPISLSLLLGTWAHRRRVRLIGADPSWKRSLPLGVLRTLRALRLD